VIGRVPQLTVEPLALTKSSAGKKNASPFLVAQVSITMMLSASDKSLPVKLVTSHCCPLTQVLCTSVPFCVLRVMKSRGPRTTTSVTSITKSSCNAHEKAFVDVLADALAKELAQASPSVEHQHNRYDPPAAVTSVVPQLTVAPFAETTVALPTSAKPLTCPITPQVSRTM
jgi:hypothetical protein